MNGLAGLGAGISQGLDKVADAFVNRQKIQQQAEAHKQSMQQNAGIYDMKQQAFAQQTELNDMKLQEMQMKFDELSNQLTRRDIFDALRAYEATGDASLLNNVRKNPKAQALLANYGMQGFVNLSDYSDEKKASFGITDEVLSNPSKRIVGVIDSEGNQTITDLMQIYAKTGFITELGEAKLKDIGTYAKAQQVKAEADIAQNKATISDIATNDIISWLTANPDKSYKDYQASVAKSYAPSNMEKERKEFDRQLEAGEIDKAEHTRLVQGLNDKYTGNTKTSGQKEDASALDLYERVKSIQGVENVSEVDVNKLDSKDKSEFIIRAQREQKLVDKELAETSSILNTAFSRLTDDLSNLSGAVDARVASFMDSLGMDIDSDIARNMTNYNAITNYMIVAINGTRASDADADRFAKQFADITKSDGRVKESLAENLHQIIARYEAVATTAPAWYAVNLKDKVDNMKTMRDALGTSTPSSIKADTLMSEDGTLNTSKLVKGDLVEAPNGKVMAYSGTNPDGSIIWSEPAKSKGK